MRVLQKMAVYLCFTMLFGIVSCQNKNDKKANMRLTYEWEEGTSAPIGYPIWVYRGGFATSGGDSASLYGGITDGTDGWGLSGGGYSHGFKTIPDHLNVTWISYAEDCDGDCIYTIDTPLDQKKITDYFHKGFDYKTVNGTGEIRHGTYSKIVAGFAPGGVVVVWLYGTGSQIEIGRYQGHRITIPQSKIESLGYPDKTYFGKKNRDEVMKDPGIVPLEVQKAREGKPIPFGLWDTYRKRYWWKPVFELPEGEVLNERGTLQVFFFNGEMERVFNEHFPLKNYGNQAMPRRLSMTWKDTEGLRYAGSADLNEASVFSAFKEVYGDHPEDVRADLVIRINRLNSFFTVELRGNGKSVFIKTEDLKTFKMRYQN